MKQVILGLVFLNFSCAIQVDPPQPEPSENNFYVNNSNENSNEANDMGHPLEVGNVGSSIPGQSGGWSASGELVPLDVDKAVSMQSNFPEAGNYTVELSIARNTEQVTRPGDIVTAQAEITWKVEGNTVRRLVSCVNGMSITGTGQGVRVIVRDTSVFADHFPTPPDPKLPYPISIQVAPGVRGSNKQPPFLEDQPFMTTVLAGSVATFDVPIDAGVNSVFVSSNLMASIQVRHVAAGILKQYELIYVNDWVPLSPGTGQINLLNTGLVDAQAKVTWGIDG